MQELRRFSEDPQSGAFEIWFESCEKEILEKLRSAAGGGYCDTRVSVGYIDDALNLATLPESLKHKLEARGLTLRECKVCKNPKWKCNVVEVSCSWPLPDSPVSGTVVAITPSPKALNPLVILNPEPLGCKVWVLGLGFGLKSLSLKL